MTLQPRQFEHQVGEWKGSISPREQLFPFEPEDFETNGDQRPDDVYEKSNQLRAAKELKRKLGHETIDWDARRERFYDEY